MYRINADSPNEIQKSSKRRTRRSINQIQLSDCKKRNLQVNKNSDGVKLITLTQFDV